MTPAQRTRSLERPRARASPHASGARPNESMLVMSKESMLVMSKESMLVMSKESMLVMIQESMLVMIQDLGNT